MAFPFFILTIDNSEYKLYYYLAFQIIKGGGHLKERRKPGPHPEKPLEHDLKVRVDNETLAKIEFCMKELSMTRSEVLRKGVTALYERLQKK